MKHSVNEDLTRRILENNMDEVTIPRQDNAQCVLPDLYAVHEGKKYAVYLKSVSAPRIVDVIGRFAVAILELRSDGPKGYTPLIIVQASGWGQNMLENVREFVDKHGPRQTAWALMDVRKGVFHMERRISATKIKPVVWYAEPLMPSTTVAIKREGRLFSDLNSWMLKILCLKDAPKKFWSGPRSPKIQNPKELAKEADVSVQKAYTFFNTFSQKDFIRVSPDKGLHVVRLRSLLDMWLSASARQSPVLTHARSVYGSLDNWESLSKASRGLKFALGGFEACRRLGVLHASVRIVPFVHIQREMDISKFVKNWSLQFCGEQEAELSFVNARSSKTVFRGVQKKRSIPVVDIIQAALDVAPLPGRGMEQAEQIKEMVLEWANE